jgi:hypothetical protein
MEDNDRMKLIKILKESSSIIEKKEPSSDISFQWVEKNEDLTNLEAGIPIVSFIEIAEKRNKEMEFRVFFK